MKTQNKKLMAYSASAVCLLQIHSDVNAQAVYVDIDPDTILSEHYDMFILDIDGDGHNDFDFYNLSYMHYGISSGDWNRIKQRIFAGVRYFGDIDNNAIVGFTHLSYEPGGGGFFTAYSVSNLEGGFLVGQDASFNPWVAQIMDRRDFWPGILSTGDTLLLGSVDYGEWIHDVEDGYLGVKFRAGDDSTHYGWIRCTVKDDGPAGFQLIIKDYAYELKANAPIMAGDTIGGLPAPEDTTIIDTTVLIANQQDIPFSIYSFGKTIYINTSSVEQSYRIVVCDLQGKKITNRVSNLKHNEIVVDVPPGIYILQIIDEKNTLNKKVYLE